MKRKERYDGKRNSTMSTAKPSRAGMRGIISMTRRGVGYVTLEGTDAIDDIEVREDRLGTALHRDIVEINVFPKQGRGRVEGEVVNVLERSKSEFVGTLRKDTEGWLFSPDETRIHVDFVVSAQEGVSLKEGHKALMKMNRWIDPKKTPEGVIVRMLGKAGVMETERNAIVLARGFDIQFPSDVQTEALTLAKHARITKRDEQERKDFRGVPTITIDPSDAKDFDDALSVRELPGGNVEIGIHIADVSHYVTPGSALDQEAVGRGTSVYLVGETVPMLPEALSNNLCSLNPNEDKLTFSAVFTFSQNAEIESEWFGRTIIRSDKRFTYEDAQKVLDVKSGTYARELIVLNSLAKRLRSERFKKGSVDFDSDEVSIVLDENGNPISIKKKERLETNMLVEEFMLCANRRVAEFVYTKQKKKERGDLVFVYRVHDTPDRDKLEELSIFLKAIGYDFQKTKETKGKISSHDINALFKEIAGKPEEQLIKVATIRTMAKAVYTTKNIGHFGLAFRYYTHFTSPIRRYPDIMVHRLLTNYLEETPIPQSELSRYQKLALQSSEREMAAVEAERESIKYAQVRYMERHIGEEFDALVSGVTSWGIYVEERTTKAEGLIRISSLSDDYYRFNQERYALVGEKTKKKYTLGDRVRIRLVHADPQTKTLDFILFKESTP